jgi:diguanylate cyclase (GGDEF)-like protein/PAS domain S-box-containing protein
LSAPAPSLRTMPVDHPHPAPFDASTFLFPAEWHAFSDLLGGTDTALLLLREDVILHLNTHLADRLGYDAAELIGQPVDALVPPGQVPHTNGQHITLMTKAGKPVEFRFIANRIDTLTDASCTIWVLQPEHAEGSVPPDEEHLQALAEYLPDLLLLCDADTTLTYANKSFDDIAGRREGKLIELVHQDDRARLAAALARAQDDGEAPVALAFRLRQHDGAWRHMAGQARKLPTAEGGLILSAHDITAQLQQQGNVATEKKRQLHYLNRLLRMARQPHANLESALTVILKSSAKALAVQRCAYWETDDDPLSMRCLMAYDDIRQNFIEETPEAGFVAAFHSLLQQVLREEPHLAVSDVDQDPRAALYCEYFHAAGIKALIAVPVQRQDERRSVLMLSCVGQPRHWRKDETEFADQAAGLIAQIYREVERSHTEARLRHLAQHDSLTGLPNRYFLFEQAADIFPKVTAKANTLAAFFIDLDGFKAINDSLGHAVGDELLKAAAMRLRNVVRKDDILARLGGDEFMLLAQNLRDMRIADDIAAQIVDTMRGTFSLQGRDLQLSASVGIALYPSDGTDIDTLMKKADIAMYQAKSAGRGCYQMFAQSPEGGAAQQPMLECELRHAIGERELQHYYQPQIDLRTGKIACVEALLRWRHPRLGMLLPARFLPMAEESGLIRDISRWVLNDACAQLRAWSGSALSDIRIALNLSASQLLDRTLLADLESALERNGVEGRRLEWELKENTVMQHQAMTSSMLERAAGLGIVLSIDDFGTGYSNMAYLRRYPVQKVKIDASFVSGLPDAEDDRAIADAIIAMAQSLELDVVAEGVETQRQMEYLRERGCGIAQGYFFTQPITAEQFEKWLIRH